MVVMGTMRPALACVSPRGRHYKGSQLLTGRRRIRSQPGDKRSDLGRILARQPQCPPARTPPGAGTDALLCRRYIGLHPPRHTTQPIADSDLPSRTATRRLAELTLILL